MRFVGNQYTDSPRPARVHEKFLELEQPAYLGRRYILDPEVDQDRLQELVRAQSRVQHHAESNLAAWNGSQHTAEQRGLSGAGIAGDHDEALLFQNAVQQCGERLPMAGGLKEKTGIGRHRERLLLKAKMRFVHYFRPQ